MLQSLIQKKDDKQMLGSNLPQELPVLPLRNVVAFPHMVLPLAIGIARSVQLLEDALDAERLIVLTAMTEPSIEEPGPDGVYQVGTLAHVERVVRLEDDDVAEYQIIVRGLVRVRIVEWLTEEPYLKARVELSREEIQNETEIEALRRELLDLARRMVAYFPQVPEEAIEMLKQVPEPDVLLYAVASNLRLDVEQAQGVLSAEDLTTQMRSLLRIMHRELEVLEVGEEIREEAQSEMEKTQREYYLRQQLKAIQKELGEDEEGSETEVYRKRLEEADLPAEAFKEAKREVDRLAQLHPQSAEVGVIKTYLDWLLDLPWKELSEDHLDLDHAQTVLDDDHYDLERVKERILEFLAVRKLHRERDIERPEEYASTILCFVGPPGVGKTSLGRSIARAMERRFTRMSLGGLRDEAEIRGHRRTYIGAMPGRIIQALKRVGTRNPVFMLDEVDKVGSSWRGDPASALLEVLDPQQNHAFRDHYLDLDFDLSDVFFITTANTLSTIPPALQDRMEVIEIDGYTEHDKVQIAEGYLVPRQLKVNGLAPTEVDFAREALRTVIRDYTREAGVRNLEREIGRALRKVAMNVARCTVDSATCLEVVDEDKARQFLGKPRYRDEAQLGTELPGVATGLAWTPAGGKVLFVEARAMEGKDKLLLTGQLGDVMKESARIALSFVQGELHRLGVVDGALEDKTVHLHVPAGAIPKDGPSAGVTLVTALVSVLTDRPVREDVGMTGEVTLQGRVLPVGGIKQKVLAAHRRGLGTVILPKANEVDLDDVPEEICDALNVELVEHVEEVLQIAFQSQPEIESTVIGGNGRDK
ncbi:MAG: endopeptidase La [Anaerolineae bacterium]|jgi:ATP-dependent Lon protease